MLRDVLEDSFINEEVSFQNSFYTSLPRRTQTKEINFSALNLPPSHHNIFYLAERLLSSNEPQEQETPTYNHHSRSPQTKRTRSLEEVITVIQAEKELESKLELHIHQQKKMVIQIFKEILEKTQKCLINHQNRLISDLEISLENFRLNFQDLKTRYHNFIETELNAPVKRIQLQDTQQLYNLLSKVYEDSDIFDASSVDGQSKLDLLLKIKHRIEQVSDKMPIIKGLEKISSFEINRALASTLDSSLRQELTFENFVDIIDERYTLSSSRVAKDLPDEIIEALQKAYKPLNSPSIEYNLTYDAAKNEYQVKEIARNLKYHEQSLLLIKTECDRVFGFYTDKHKSFAINFDERQVKFHSSFSDYMKNTELKKIVCLDLANCIKLKAECNKNKNNIANFGESVIYFCVKELAIYEVSGLVEPPSPLKSANKKPLENTLKLEKKFGLIHSLIKQKMNL